MPKPSPATGDLPVTLKAAAALFGRSVRWVQDLKDSGHLVGGGREGYRLGPLCEAVIAHYEGLLEQGQRKTAASSASLARTREIEQRIAIKAGQLIDIDEARGAMADLAGMVDAALVSLPARISADPAERERVRAIVDAARSEIVDRLGEAGGSLGSGGADHRAAADPDAE